MNSVILIFLIVCPTTLVALHGICLLKTHPIISEITNHNADEIGSFPEVTLTILVAAWNAENDIVGFIESFHKLQWVQKQLVLCIGGTDRGYDTALQHSTDSITIIEQLPGVGKQGGLRAAYPFVTGTLIYLTDIDCNLSNQTIQKLYEGLVASHAGCAGGGIRPLDRQLTNPFVNAQWAIYEANARHGGTTRSGLHGANALVWKHALDSCGAFSHHAVSGTDYVLAKELIRNGQTICNVHNATVETEFPDRFMVYTRKQARWIRNVLILGKKYGETTEVRSVAMTILFAYTYLFLVLIGVLWSLSWWIFALVWLHSFLNRLRYGKLTDVRLSIGGILLSMTADWVAAIRASLQTIFRRYTW